MLGDKVSGCLHIFLVRAVSRSQQKDGLAEAGDEDGHFDEAAKCVG